MIRRRVLVSGTVQGVFFRDSCRRAAAEAEVTGWVRNLPDGRVEAVFEGDPAPVERMVAWMGHGPSRAVVERVEVVEEQPEGLLVFAVTT
ncbi:MULTISPECIES: acylphosphatase [Kitasatospora]|uniref:Acylphosphatase n=1 Tax=Kitasatospora cineracea TaxID=88074 RepID=A0A3N4SE81_9ACTN|nr:MULTISPECIES: acylphosphatase [Kitasatospora]ROR46758.1 acylphosphatase [Kitasatospora cineracea]RPE36930.1 acylphosphatase [Kitasatospora cineracea]